MDRIRIIPAKTFLSDAAAQKSGTADRFLRRVYNEGRKRPQSITLTLPSGHYNLLTVVVQLLQDGIWHVTCIDANLPALLHGHNGRPLRTSGELALSLTRLRHFAKLVTRSDSREHLTPGLGFSNHAYIRTVECMVQLQDAGHRFLKASHVTCLPNQRKSPLICWGQSTLFKSVKFDLSIYDKSAQRRAAGVVLPPDTQGTRVECKIKCPARLADEVNAIGLFRGEGGEVLRTLSLETSYAIVRRQLTRMSGWAMTPAEALRDLPTPARNLAIGLGDRIGQPHVLDKALADYRAASAPCQSTWSRVTKSLRAYSTVAVGGNSPLHLPDALDDVPWSDLALYRTERDYQRFLVETDAPMEPCPAILRPGRTPPSTRPSQPLAT